MATVLMLHSAYGLRPSVHRAASRLREQGHRVETPDLYGCGAIEPPRRGLDVRDSIGAEELLRRASAAASRLPAETVYLGFSLGAWLAQELAARNRLARGLVLLQGLGIPGGQLSCPVQVHVSQGDLDRQELPVNSWVPLMRAQGNDLQTFVYETQGHLYMDEDLTEYDATACALAWRRVDNFLLTCDSVEASP
ncbi:dienelactone hydrolase family protein [Longimycelium tulufanense]|nr:alpha/beta fold hydrolase [Longimycelium tulufanense]